MINFSGLSRVFVTVGEGVAVWVGVDVGVGSTTEGMSVMAEVGDGVAVIIGGGMTISIVAVGLGVSFRMNGIK